MSKAILITFSFLISCVAFSGEPVLVFEKQFEMTSVYANTVSFDYSKNRGTGYINLGYSGMCIVETDPNRMVCDNFSLETVPVPNLVFDKTIGKRGAVVYKANGRDFVCGYDRFFWGLKETGQCKLEITRNRKGEAPMYGVRLYIIP